MAQGLLGGADDAPGLGIGHAHGRRRRPEGALEGDFLRPRPAEWSIAADLVLASREVPVYEGNGDGTVSYFTELWEF